MVSPAIGSVVTIPFPFSDLSQSKLRPAIVLAKSSAADWILCQVTSNPYSDNRAIELTDVDFTQGSLAKVSYARPGKLFTASENLMLKEVGRLKKKSLKKILGSVIELFEAGMK